ncbi:Putative uncharacterized protein [Taphrina deformans PYCC 5710]|uniref:Nuclear speckle splicing regulatory protein 1 N-terminal domain-containing protein n=1 Tax=Taphrina deformans (strain PYCC 5710 / ATCC 11124 / CBS 356.35 / IMI 108563 / JCM 9778 / NBRC 8474) TaxID=1097556 RepID=R4XD01_TAPDE|nr:Putative uncharacterized protein [Taphrina deformans PYCC 5710]|eukprot:CCG81200.1 Putative uncharacterized protein [Taphrina deformans PYCC 5710]
MLSSGLNIRKKTAPPVALKSSLAAFDIDSDSGEESIDRKKIASGRLGQSKSSLKDFNLDESDIAYDYDGVYDSMKSGERELKSKKEADKKQRKPKYMQNLFQMAEIRKRDRLRAEDVKLRREREAEGDEFADKEKFVTSAYKAQQEELRRIEREEDEKERILRQKAGGFVAFNQNLLANDEERHDLAVSRTTNITNSSADDEIERDSQSIADQQLLKLAEERLGHKIAVNDDNQIVDHRQLLGAGLNRATRSDSHLKTSELAKKQSIVYNQQDREDRKAQIERQQRILDEQLRASNKRAAEESKAKEEQVKAQAKRSKTEGDIKSAKERYLARKQAQGD